MPWTSRPGRSRARRGAGRRALGAGRPCRHARQTRGASIGAGAARAAQRWASRASWSPSDRTTAGRGGSRRPSEGGAAAAQCRCHAGSTRVQWAAR
eukprot:320811-Prymnesium_polylepis.1